MTFFEIILEKMDPEDQQFYNEYNKYIVNPHLGVFVLLSDVWKWLGFPRQRAAKRLLKSNFEETVEFSIVEKKTLMTIDTFECLCMQANTYQGRNARKFHMNVIKIASELEVTYTVSQIEEFEKLRLEKISLASLTKDYMDQYLHVKSLELHQNNIELEQAKRSFLQSYLHAIKSNNFRSQTIRDAIARNELLGFERS
jgi:hypothetical protein